MAPRGWRGLRCSLDEKARLPAGIAFELSRLQGCKQVGVQKVPAEQWLDLGEGLVR